jgi:sugar phosphate isomerase/epimerase
MQNDVGKITGVSPAYYISKYGTSFSCNEVRTEMQILNRLGFNASQLEIFEKNMLESWTEPLMSSLLQTAREQGIMISVFVAHFIGEYFTEVDNINRTVVLNIFNRVLDIIKPLSENIPIAIPLMPLKAEAGKHSQDGLFAACRLLGEMAELAHGYNRALIVEVVPGSAAGSYSAFINEEPWNSLSEITGFLLDTGHANICGENITDLIYEMGSRLKVLHLSDNDGIKNLSLIPGKGNIDWSAVIAALEKIGYRGSLDLEIVCNTDSVESEYSEGRLVLEKIIEHHLLLEELI